MTTSSVDVSVTNHGSLFGLSIRTPAARDWVADNLATEAWQWMGDTLHVEPRYASDIVEGMQGDGLAVE